MAPFSSIHIVRDHKTVVKSPHPQNVSNEVKFVAHKIVSYRIEDVVLSSSPVFFDRPIIGNSSDKEILRLFIMNDYH